jgi:hypothetical protein
MSGLKWHYLNESSTLIRKQAGKNVFSLTTKRTIHMDSINTN